MKAIIGILMILGGIILGLYMGGWVMFIGGIMDIINVIQGSAPAEAATEVLVIGLAIFKIMFASLVGWVSAFILILPGVALIDRGI